MNAHRERFRALKEHSFDRSGHRIGHSDAGVAVVIASGGTPAQIARNIAIRRAADDCDVDRVRIERNACTSSGALVCSRAHRHQARHPDRLHWHRRRPRRSGHSSRRWQRRASRTRPALDVLTDPIGVCNRIPPGDGTHNRGHGSCLISMGPGTRQAKIKDNAAGLGIVPRLTDQDVPVRIFASAGPCRN